MNEDNKTTIYFILAKDTVKIGVATDMEERIKDMQTGNPYPLKILYSLPATTKMAYRLESQLHLIFENIQLHGEWFAATPALLGFIENIRMGDLRLPLSWIASYCEIKKPPNEILTKNITETLRKWVLMQGEIFTNRDIFNQFNLTTKKEKNNARVALHRLVKQEKIINKISTATYKRVDDN